MTVSKEEMDAKITQLEEKLQSNAERFEIEREVLETLIASYKDGVSFARKLLIESSEELEDVTEANHENVKKNRKGKREKQKCNCINRRINKLFK